MIGGNRIIKIDKGNRNLLYSLKQRLTRSLKLNFAVYKGFCRSKCYGLILNQNKFMFICLCGRANTLMGAKSQQQIFFLSFHTKARWLLTREQFKVVGKRQA